MDNQVEEHIDKIVRAVNDWLRPDNTELKLAIDETVDNKLFSFEDLKHRIKSLKSTIHKKGLLKWAEQSSLKFQSLKNKKVVCLHAGNLPLVGIQDLLAVVMTGGIYLGKLSKNDPYLLPTFLKVLRNHGLLNKSLWTTRLQEFRDIHGESVLFAGSVESVDPVMNKLLKLNIIDKNTPALMRTSHFSIAFIEDNQPKTMKDLTEAAFRYGGTGCRSVAIVVAPFHLNSQKCTFTDYVESFWLKNPQHEKPTEKLHHRFAYNKAVEIPQAWLNDFLIEENISDPVDKFILYWVKGSEENLPEIVNEYKDGLQSVYVQPGSDINIIEGVETELLSTAQHPPIYWKPDNIDSIEWLQKNINIEN